jgi:hypothetical protein
MGLILQKRRQEEQVMTLLDQLPAELASQQVTIPAGRVGFCYGKPQDLTMAHIWAPEVNLHLVSWSSLTT